jgi:hypothetical protein
MKKIEIKKAKFFIEQGLFNKALKLTHFNEYFIKNNKNIFMFFFISMIVPEGVFAGETTSVSADSEAP